MSCRILSQDCRISNESYLTGLNNNDLIVGPSGAGKTRGYVLPNILQCSESLIVADTKNTLRAETEAVLRQNGYKIYSLDLCGGPSSGYDPLDYIRLDPQTSRYSEQDIMAVAAALAPIESPQEPFWEFSARIYLESIIGYVLECLPEEEHTVDMVVRLSRELGTGRLAKLMDELALLDPDSFAVRRYTICRDGERADKTNACVLMFLAEKLAPLDYEGAKAMFHNPDKIHMAQLGREKTALFLGVSDTDRSMDRLANLFYTQALHVLCDEADRSPGHRLDVPVRFILDDFAANVFIPDFDKILSVIRSRNISASVILQSISQLEGMYGHAAAMTILNNCDHCLYLGGQDVETARYMGVKANRSVGTMLSMPLDSAWLFARGEPARLTKKFELRSHQRYCELLEAGGRRLEHEEIEQKEACYARSL
ncbi:type IV secretory system conjugative DNA transfer family protein [Oscillospiraceae bacterium 42-9]